MTSVAGRARGRRPCARAAGAYSCANRSRSGSSYGSTSGRAADVDAELRRPCARIVGRVAEQGQVGDAAAQQRCRRRAGSAPPRPRAARCGAGRRRARSSSSCSNISGVTTVAARHLEPVEQRVAVDVLGRTAPGPCSILRGGVRGEAAPTVGQRRRRSRSVPRSVAMIGSGTSSAVEQPVDLRRGSAKPAVEHDRRRAAGRSGDWCAMSTPSTTSARSPGVITTAPSKSRSSTLRHRHRGDHEAEDLAVEQLRRRR